MKVYGINAACEAAKRYFKINDTEGAEVTEIPYTNDFHAQKGNQTHILDPDFDQEEQGAIVSFL